MSSIDNTTPADDASEKANFFIYHSPEAQPETILQVLQEALPAWTISSPEHLSPSAHKFPASSTPSNITPTSLHKTRLSLSPIESQHNIQIILLPSPIGSLYPPQIAVFDLDSTLIAAEVIDELARSIGAMPAVAAITERAMNGEIDFAASLRLRVALLKGVQVPKVWEDLKARIEFMPGARELCRALRRMGVRIAVFSGGFVPMATWVAEELGIERVAANQLVSAAADEEFGFEHLTGELEPGAVIVTAEKKREFVRGFAEEYGVPLSRVMCVGDGANDLLMLGEVWQAGGLAVAFRAKEKVQREAGNRYNGQSLTDLLCLFGKNEKEIQALTAEDGAVIEKRISQLMPGLRL